MPYCLRVTGTEDLRELIQGSELRRALRVVDARNAGALSVMSRLRRHENSTVFAKMRVYDGESLKESDRSPSVQEYKDAAGVDEGMDGV